MNIGEFKNVNGRLLGWIATRSIDLPKLGLRPVESSNDRAPVFEIVALNVGNRWVQVGALWEAVAKNTTGEIFLQGSIDDPSLAEPLPIALFGSDEDGFRVAWRRQQPRDVFAPVIREMEEKQLLCQSIAEQREAVETMRDLAAEMYRALSGWPWSPARGSKPSATSASHVDALDFLRARALAARERHMPQGPKRAMRWRACETMPLRCSTPRPGGLGRHRARPSCRGSAPPR